MNFIQSSLQSLQSLPEYSAFNQPVYCAPGEQIDEKIVEELSKINKRRKDSNYPKYLRSLKKLFPLLKNTKRETREIKESKKRTRGKGTKFSLLFAGFFLGEGSINVSAKKNSSSRFGIMLDPEFSVTQHVNGISHLMDALELFKTGTIRYKSKSNATFVFRIDNRKSLSEICIPFCEKFCVPYASEAWNKRFYLFKDLLELFIAGEHVNEKGFIYKMLPIWHQLRKQPGQRKSTFQSLDQAQGYAKNVYLSKE